MDRIGMLNRGVGQGELSLEAGLVDRKCDHSEQDDRKAVTGDTSDESV